MWGMIGHYELSRQIRKEKMQNIAGSGADTVLSWCSVCVIQMRDGLSQEGSDMNAINPLELLSQAYGKA
jgi:glycolate oxidase iron-sulfur subunit